MEPVEDELLFYSWWCGLWSLSLLLGYQHLRAGLFGVPLLCDSWAFRDCEDEDNRRTVHVLDAEVAEQLVLKTQRNWCSEIGGQKHLRECRKELKRRPSLIAK